MTDGDIHNVEQTLNNTADKILKSSEISQRDKKLLIEGTEEIPSFYTYLQNQEMSKTRINRYISTWRSLAEYTSWNIEEVNKAKLTELIGELHQDHICKKNGEAYAESSKREIKKGVRKMYADYVENFKDVLNVSDAYDSEEIINFTLTIDRKFTDPDRLPTPNTVRKLVENMSRTRDKAYLLLLWSTGGRHGEILGLKWKDVVFTNSVGKVKFRDTKTGGDHSVPMGEAYPFMKRLHDDDSLSSDPESFVFRSSHSNKQLSAGGAANIISRVRSKTDISSRVKTNPHAFRKGRTTYWARQGKSEAWICKHMNWSQGSNIVRHYCRLMQEDVEQGVAEHLGLKHREDDTRDESKVLTPAECHECKTVNSFQEDVCDNCGEALRTGDLFVEQQIYEKSNLFMKEVISSKTEFEPEELDEKAKKFVKDELDLD